MKIALFILTQNMNNWDTIEPNDYNKVATGDEDCGHIKGALEEMENGMIYPAIINRRLLYCSNMEEQMEKVIQLFLV